VARHLPPATCQMQGQVALAVPCRFVVIFQTV